MQRNTSSVLQNDALLNLYEAVVPTLLAGLTASLFQYFEFSNLFSAIAGGTVAALAVNYMDKQTVSRKKNMADNKCKAHWEEYSEKYKGQITIDVFKRHHLSQYLNAISGMVQLGASTGSFLKIFRDTYKREVVGYDLAGSAIKKMKEHNIPAKQIDLNSIDKKANTLTYAAELDEDLANPTNILLIRVLNHLDINAMNVLLSYIITNAKSGSVIFISGDINKQTKYRKDYSGQTKNYKASFFGGRTDMEFLKMENKPAISNQHHQAGLEEEVLVVRKR